MNVAGTPALSGWQLAQIDALRRERWTIARIAARLGVTPRTIHRVIQRRYVCGHCRQRFMYAGDLWAHVQDPT